MSSSANPQHEPTMEEILASIRRIIADDDTAKPAAAKPAAPPPRPAAMPPRNPIPPSPPAAAPRPAAPPPSPVMDQSGIDAMLAGHDAPPPPADDVLDLTEQMAEPAEGETPSFQTIDGQADVFFADAPAQPEPPPRAAEPPPRQYAAPQPSMPDRGILSSTTSAAFPRMVDVIGATVTVARWPIALARVSTRTGRCLSGGGNRHRRTSPLLRVAATMRRQQQVQHMEGALRPVPKASIE